MSETETAIAPIEWLTLPDLVKILDETLGRVHRLLDEQHLVGSRRNGPLAVPALFLQEDRPLPALRGTIIVLKDAGFSDDEVIDWLLAEEESIGRSPIAALRDGHKSEVRRVARALA